MPCHRLVRWLQTHADCPYSLSLTAVIACSMAVGLPGRDTTSISTTTIVSISAISLGRVVTCLCARSLPAYADPRGAEPWLTPCSFLLSGSGVPLVCQCMLRSCA